MWIEALVNYLPLTSHPFQVILTGYASGWHSLTTIPAEEAMTDTTTKPKSTYPSRGIPFRFTSAQRKRLIASVPVTLRRQLWDVFEEERRSGSFIEEPSTTYEGGRYQSLPFHSCDTCQRASVSQSPTDPYQLQPTCPMRGERTYDPASHRVLCILWAHRRELSEGDALGIIDLEGEEAIND